MDKKVRRCKSCQKELSDYEDKELCQSCRERKGKNTGKKVLAGLGLLFGLVQLFKKGK